jgi:hypothetical protein
VGGGFSGQVIISGGEAHGLFYTQNRASSDTEWIVTATNSDDTGDLILIAEVVCARFSL